MNTNFIEWLEGLELQTLTDELKSEIIERVESHYNTDNLYVRIPWPESQVFMDEPWFTAEAILDIDTSADFLIPLYRIQEKYETTETE
jgi:hypothetical protein